MAKRNEMLIPDSKVSLPGDKISKEITKTGNLVVKVNVKGEKVTYVGYPTTKTVVEHRVHKIK